jgi:DNA-binding NarL/FixJ family response regulator
VRVLIAEDSGLLRAALAGLLSDYDVEVVAAVGDGEALLRALAEEEVDACVVDVRMPPTFTDEGLRAALVIRSRWPGVGILVLSQYVEERYAGELLAGGVRGLGYLLKDKVADASEFVDALRRVASGGTALDPDVVAQLFARTRHRSPLDRLSPRERNVLEQLAQGHSNAGVGEALGIGAGAVEKHITSIFTKLDLDPSEGHRRVQAVLAYLEER